MKKPSAKKTAHPAAKKAVKTAPKKVVRIQVKTKEEQPANLFEPLNLPAIAGAKKSVLAKALKKFGLPPVH